MVDEINNLYEFGDFRFNAAAMTLWRGDELIALSPKALELLKLLVERRGEIVSKQEIFDSVWGDTFVEDGVLTQNIYTLRKTLGNDENGKQYIENIARRGYRLSVPINSLAAPNANLARLNTNSKEILLATQTKIITEEFIEEDESKLLSGKTPFYRRKTFVLFGFGVMLVSLAAFFLYLYPPRKLGFVFKSQVREMQFQRLTDTGNIAYLVVSPDGEFVAFNNRKNIFLKDLRSGGEVTLNVENLEEASCLQFSPDSSALFFGNNPEPNAPGKIFQTARFGGTAKLVAENVWSGFSLSPDGRKLAFHRKFPNENRWALILKNLESGAETELAERNLPEEYYWNNYPAWSADGKKIAAVVVSRTEHFLRLLAIDAETGGEEEIKMPPDFRNVEQVLWTADGSSFIASANAGENFQLYQIDYPSGAARRITNDLNDYLGISITADGKKLLSRQRIYYSNIWIGEKENLGNLRQLTVGTSRNDGLKGLTWLDNEKIIYTSNAEKLRDWNLWMVNANDNARHELTFDAKTQNEEPAVAPDGKSIYFSSNRAVSAHIWRVGVDGGNLEQITFSEDKTELYPQISPDGAWLYYIRKDRNSTAIQRKSLNGEKTENLTDERKLAPDTFLSLSPNGKYLAFQNLTEKNQSGSREFQIGIIETENPGKVKFFNLQATGQFIEWTAGEDAFDYFIDSLGGAEIWRQKLNENAKPALILNLPKDDIFNFAWSKDGQHLAVSRGQLLRDAVLLTDFAE